ncbi:MAG TPA: hypothetical protein VLX68_03365 [Chitinivibrionales bacterium]|nr:hypothetical protein [Chitinivibrionales bacterium]
MAVGQMIRTTVLGFLAAASACFAQADDSATGNQQPSQPPRAVSQPAVQESSGAVLPAAQAPRALNLGNDVQNKVSLFGAVDEGQVMRGTANRSNYDLFKRVWQQSMIFHLTNDLSYRDRMHLILSFESGLDFSYKQDNRYPATLTGVFNFYPNDVEMNYAFGNPDMPWLKLSAGYFPFKYNPDAKDLGEYLLRSTAYPTVIYTWWEFPMVRELGFHLNGTLDWLINNPQIDQFKWDLMLTSETQGWPLQDWTFSALVSNNLLQFFDLGAGVSFQRYLSVDEAKTTPHIPQNSYLNENGDTSYYTFKSIKLMGRASLNLLRFVPKFKLPLPQFFGNKPFFGPEDLKVYGELAVLGLQNQTAYMWDTTGVGAGGQQKLVVAPRVNPVANGPVNYYDSLGDRMPYMVGINLPTQPLISYGILPFLLTKWLKDETGDDIRQLSYVTLVPALASGVCNYFLGWDLGLDVFSLEFEWVSQRFPFDDYGPLNFTGGNVPLPASNANRLNYLAQKGEGSPQTVKYALYFKKSFFNQRLALSGLVARDHMRPPYNGEYVDAVTDDFTQTKNQWWWTFRLSANF